MLAEYYFLCDLFYTDKAFTPKSGLCIKLKKKTCLRIHYFFVLKFHRWSNSVLRV